MTELKPVTLYSASPSGAGQGSELIFEVPAEANGLCYVQIKQAAGGGSDTLKAKIQGRMTSGLGWVDLKKQDQTTEASSAQTAGAAKEEIIQCQLMPRMRVDISGTITGARAVSVTVLGIGAATRTNS